MKNEMLLNALESHKMVRVQFRTKTGSVRTMDCSRVLDCVPELLREGINTPKLNGPEIVCVFDHLIGDWRAFRWDSVIAFEVNNLHKI